VAFRCADDELLVNVHAYGTPVANAAFMHLTRSDDQGPTATYIASFNHIRSSARPHGGRR
jgi:hypothetical protein